MSDSKRPTKEDIICANAQVFVSDLTATVEGVLTRHLEPTDLVDDIDVITNEVVGDVISMLEGTGNDDGYYVVPQEADLALIPATKEAAEHYYKDNQNPVGLSITEALRKMFDELQE